MQHIYVLCSLLTTVVIVLTQCDCFGSSDLSHNKLKSRTGRALGKLLGMPACRLETLVLTNNEIGPDGGKSLGHSLKTNSTLLHLDLRLNRYGASISHVSGIVNHQQAE